MGQYPQQGIPHVFIHIMGNEFYPPSYNGRPIEMDADMDFADGQFRMPNPEKDWGGPKEVYGFNMSHYHSGQSPGMQWQQFNPQRRGDATTRWITERAMGTHMFPCIVQ